MWYVYILKCKDNTLYTGVTNDLLRRFKQHNDGKGAKYTAARRPVKLMYAETSKDRSEAQKREAEIKSFSRQTKLNIIASSQKTSINKYLDKEIDKARFC